MFKVWKREGEMKAATIKKLICVSLASLVFCSFGAFFSTYRIFIGQGMSMEPNIHDGAIILAQINGFNANDFSVGTIILYRYNATLNIGHRIIIRHSNPVCYEVKGDNNPFPDDVYVWPKDVLAVLVLILWN